MAETKVTSMDVAVRAGVSQSAVSRVFTPGASASKKTVEKVRKAAAELGYRPNILARAMVSGKSRMIGLVVAYLENYFYPEALEKLSNALQAQGYHVLVFMASQTAVGIDAVVEEILDYQVDGIVFASVAMSSDIAERCEQAGVPVVLFNRYEDREGVTSVTSDNVAGGRKVADFLLAGGHSRIAYIAGWEGASTQRDREAGFLAGLRAAGADLFARGVGNFNLDQARNAARGMFDRPDRPDAVFVANDHMAFAVMDVIRFELGLSVPGDVSVVGYDDVPPAAWPAYDLTSVRQRANRMVEETVNALLSRIEDPDAVAGKIVIDGPLIVRGSARGANPHPGSEAIAQKGRNE
ncbi:LacI family DNA-binding transcriptional regulator [Mesobacterium sp. TK19101]|uniref:LacI family DNA-binding transcriptional regulator n=1 Tax=Mesobacterium hydrothermale TaxID=3111907 RepID=A0ABU6HL99_9RHOB|nr:LacI family DNA-binding transcriptional regulator [Mesobacterium sp. TK19101]MEC3862630.1 LacI family DNA-binding transcriptional regulator [Mesobacterium sp. TK19101]